MTTRMERAAAMSAAKARASEWLATSPEWAALDDAERVAVLLDLAQDRHTTALLAAWKRRGVPTYGDAP